MFCNNCGNKLDDDAMFCGECGAKICDSEIRNSSNTSKNVKKNNKNPLVVIGVSAALIVVLVVGIVIALQFNSPDRRLQSQLDLGNKFLSELNYEQAIACFEAAIDIDPKNIRAYNGLIDAYIGAENADALMSVYDRACENLSYNDALSINEQVVNGLFRMIEKSVGEGRINDANIINDFLRTLDEDGYNRMTIVISEADKTDLSAISDSSDCTDNIDIYNIEFSSDEPYIIRKVYDDGRYEEYEYTNDGVVEYGYNVNGELNSRKYYDKNGFETRFEWDNSTSEWSIDTYEYDNDGKILSYQSHFLSEGEWYDYKELYVYDASGTMKYVDWTSTDGQSGILSGQYSISYYEKNADGYVVIYNINGNQETYHYNINWEPISRNDSDGYGFTFFFDSRGNDVRMLFNDGDDYRYTNYYSDGAVLSFDNP